MRFFFTICVFSCAAVFSAFAQMKFRPPLDASVEKREDGEYLSGDIFMTGHADTLALKKLGFCEFEFAGRSVGCIKYHAHWPLTAAASEMPPAISGIDYDRIRHFGDNDEDRNDFDDGDAPVIRPLDESLGSAEPFAERPPVSFLGNRLNGIIGETSALRTQRTPLRTQVERDYWLRSLSNSHGFSTGMSQPYISPLLPETPPHPFIR